MYQQESEFNVLVHNVFLELGFEVQAKPQMMAPYIPDLLIEKDSQKAVVEIKYYRSNRVGAGMLFTAALHFAANFHMESPVEDSYTPLVLICSGIVPNGLKEKILGETGVIIWDRRNIAAFTVNSPGESYDAFVIFFLHNQSGTVPNNPFSFEVDDIPSDPLAYLQTSVEPADVQEPKQQGQMLLDKLELVDPGRSGWATFEVIAAEILQFLFKDDISIWKKQPITSDNLSRFDMIGRIGSDDDFWSTIVSSFHSRFVVFEFKNYIEPISQDQIYSTERYLFPKALRGTAIIISRKGANDGAKKAAVGALRETGKLILILDDQDLSIMLTKRDKGESPNDHLSEKLDEMLMTLSR